MLYKGTLPQHYSINVAYLFLGHDAASPVYDAVIILSARLVEEGQTEYDLRLALCDLDGG